MSTRKLFNQTDVERITTPIGCATTISFMRFKSIVLLCFHRPLAAKRSVQHGPVRLRDDELKTRVENQTVSDYGVESVCFVSFSNPVAKITFKYVDFIKKDGFRASATHSSFLVNYNNNNSLFPCLSGPAGIHHVRIRLIPVPARVNGAHKH